jgi:hypothetical protein
MHKIALVGGCLVLIAGAVLVLRDPESGDVVESEPPPPQQTSVTPFADKSIGLPDRGEKPDPPRGLSIKARENRLLVGWGPEHIGEPEPARAAGYEVRWGEGGRFTHTRYVAEPVIQLDGLQNDIQYTVVVRTVDAFGQRSVALRGQGTPSAEAVQDPALYTMIDRFNGEIVPDPQRWSLVGVGNCTKAARGAGEDVRRMVITAQCGNTGEAVALRSRTPMRLADGSAGGELGRFIVQTDRPGQTGELMLDLVPGPADLIGRPPSIPLPPAVPGRASVDESLPPGTIRVRVSGRPDGTTVRVQVAPGTPLLGKPIAVPVGPLPAPYIAVSVRWEVVLRTDGVQVLRDGVVVGGGDVVPPWREATALIGFAGGPSGLYASMDLIGFTGARTEAAPLLSAPLVDFDRAVAAPDPGTQTSANGRKLFGVRTALLRLTLLSQRNQNPPGRFIVDIGGQRIPLRTAVPGQPMQVGVRLPVVADIPPEALVFADNADFIPIQVRSLAAEDGATTQVMTAELELTGEGLGTPVTRPAGPPLARPVPALAVPAVAVYDAAGQPLPQLENVPRGRLVLEVTADAAAAQRLTGAVAGLAGIEVSLDGKQLAGIPTAAEGPGIGGRWRIALNTTEIPPGSHNLQVTAIGVDQNTAFTVAYASFVMR